MMEQELQVIEFDSVADPDALITWLWELGTLGVIETDRSIRGFFAVGVDLSALLDAFPGRVMTTPGGAQFGSPVPVSESDGILAGQRFLIFSSTPAKTAVPGRTSIQIDAQNAFGSGSHESTQLVIRALEEHLRPDSVLMDVGSGSGVISAVAGHLHARKVFACDTHVDAVLLTRRHAPGAHVFAGSIDCLSAHFADIVVANISAHVIDSLAGHLARIVKSDGWLVLSGFIADRTPALFLPRLEMSMNDWRCWLCRSHDLVFNKDLSSAASLQPFVAEWW